MASELQIVFITDSSASSNDSFLELLELVPEARLIDFYTMDMDELQFIAKYRILPAQTILCIQGAKVVARVVNEKLDKSNFERILRKVGYQFDGAV